MRYNQKLVEEVRQGKAQIQTEKTKEHNDLLNFIFPLRNWGSVNIDFMSEYFKGVDTHFGYLGQDEPFEDLPIIHASKFIEEVRWVEVSNDEEHWYKRIFICNLGGRFRNPIVAVDNPFSEKYINNESDIYICMWFFMREIQEEPKESEINKVLKEILQEYQDNEFKGIVKIIKSKITK